MRKHFDFGMESFGGHNYGEISMEEEAVMNAEAAEAANGADSDLQEAERIIQMSDSLEDLAVIADGIEEATPTEVALIENAGDMAVAGTDVPAEEVVPAMEGYVGRRIATEGIRETAKAIWDSILRFLKKVWEKIEAFFYKIFGGIPNLRRSIASLKKQADDASGKKTEVKKITINSGIKALTIDGKQQKTEPEFKSMLGDLTAASKTVFTTHMDETASLGEKIATAIADFDPAEAEKHATALYDIVKRSTPKGITGSVNTTRFPGFNTTIGGALAGDVSLCVKRFSDKVDDNTLGKLDRARRAGSELISTSEKSTKTLPNDYEMSPLSVGGVRTLMEDADKILDILEEYKRGKRSKDIVKTQKSIESASAKATKAMESANKADAKDSDGNESSERASVPYYRGMLNFNASYARWVQSPAMPLMSSVLTTIRATVVVCQKSLAGYK